MNGKMQVCCLNTKEIIGNITHNTIKEAWNGKTAELIRSSFKNNTFSDGCYDCKNQIENNEFYGVKSKLYDTLKPSVKNYPVLMEFELKNTCNLKCIMCNDDLSSAHITKNPLKQYNNSNYNTDFVNQLTEFIPFLKYTSFIGGEPFLIDLYFEIWDLIFKINPKIRINISTNGTVLNSKIKTYLEKGLFDISVSIDSIKKETYEKIRVGANLENTIKNLEWFKLYCNRKKTFFSVWICPMRINCYEIISIVQYFSELNIPIFFNTVWTPHTLSLWNWDVNNLYNLLQQLNNINSFGNNKFQKENYNRFNDFRKQIKTWYIKQIQNQNNKTYFNAKTKDLEIFFNEKLHNLKLNKIIIDTITEKLSLVIKNKNEEQKNKIYVFLINFPIEKLVDIIFNKSIEELNLYISEYIIN